MGHVEVDIKEADISQKAYIKEADISKEAYIKEAFIRTHASEIS